ncbi:MAG: extracellular solute-binding protein [Provencibacterium sp.]|jgi:putative aldouronate transport system substrate-binding protein|nr:extracellular solute-binding protein [Provencibacterium sp.]
MHTPYKLYRASTLALAAALTAVSLFGCTSGGGDVPAASSTPDASASSAASSVPEAEPAVSSAPETAGEASYPIVTDGSVKLRFWIELSGAAAPYISSYSENTALQQMEKDTGIQIEYIHPATGQVQEQFNLLMASGELPDILGSPSLYKGKEFQAMNDGVLIDLSDKIAQWAPDYAALMQEDPEFYREVTDTEGRIPAFFCYKPKGDPANARLLFREDVLQELNAEIPQTIEDYEALFDKMLAAGITPYMLARNGYEIQFISPFGVAAASNTFYKDANGKLYYGQVRPEFKGYLELMNRWFQKGYISKDFTSVDGKQTDTLFDTRQLGTYVSACVAAFNRCKQSGVVLTTAPYPRQEKGQQLHHESQDIWPVQTQASTRAGITSACKNAEAAIRYLNYGYTEKGIELLNWGVEGLNWDWKDGKRVYNDRMLNNEKMGTEAASYIYKCHFFPKYMQLATECHANLLQSPESLAIRFKWSDDPNVDSGYILPPFQMTSEETAKVSKLMTDINTYCDEMVLKFITGAESLDNFDKYVETVKSMGIEEVLEIEQAAYERYMEKSGS